MHFTQITCGNTKKKSSDDFYPHHHFPKLSPISSCCFRKWNNANPDQIKKRIKVLIKLKNELKYSESRYPMVTPFIPPRMLSSIKENYTQKKSHKSILISFSFNFTQSYFKMQRGGVLKIVGFCDLVGVGVFPL